MLSMTGFGRGSAEGPAGRMTVELRTLNHRFTELHMQMPPALSFLDGAARRRVNSAVQRGKVTCIVRFEAGEGAPSGLVVNEPLLDALAAHARRLRGGGDIAPESLFLAPGVLQPATDPAAEEEVVALFEAAFDAAAAALRVDRAREGTVLAEVLSAAEQRMRAGAVAIDAGRDLVVARYREKLNARVAELLDPGTPLDPGRLEQEVLLFADKADISEECVRLASHLDELVSLISAEDGGIGRKLDFLAQEIGREVNTVGSKCRDLDSTRHVLALKAELESLREQIANIE